MSDNPSNKRPITSPALRQLVADAKRDLARMSAIKRAEDHAQGQRKGTKEQSNHPK